MKKLMFGMAVAAAGLAFGLESANVVGYDQTGLRFGSKGAGASFVPVNGATAINMQDIKVVGYDVEEGTEGDVTAQTLDQFGRDTATYEWYDVVDGEDVYYGWYDSDFELVEDLTVLPGEGFYVRAPDTSYKFQSAGQVPVADIAVQLRFGSKLVVNPTPVTLDFQATWITGYDDEEGTEGDVTAQTLDQFGRDTATYEWYDVVDGEDVYYGWYDSNFELVENLTLMPGESLYVRAPDTSYYMNFPGVTL